MSTPANSAQAEAVTPTLLREWALPGGGSGKDDRGSVLVIGGARKTPGAALLAGVAALRAGAGRLTLAVAESVAVQLAVGLPEAGVLGLPETAAGTVVGSAAAGLGAELEAADAVLVGPGLDDKDQATALLRELLKASPGSPGNEPGSGARQPCFVLDAFALGSLPELQDELAAWAGRLILTPNITEAAILLGQDVDDLHRQVPDLAEKYQAVVTCQGVIARPGGSKGKAADEPGLWEITTGHSGLGTSGSGDVLAGAIAGLRARGTTDSQAACWGTHLHAAAGDRLASRLGGLGYLARELTEELPPLMMELSA
ncbi:NAD(P)H-hydrate dehydratase [Arthrobacter sp. NPDC058192]|uniref:NAD(P)H-hydrate dehydratase n=1 Tax=Arthrobacter sp. NPDC058192 TaxID=3346372 RepID=UPI0036E827B8